MDKSYLLIIALFGRLMAWSESYLSGAILLWTVSFYRMHIILPIINNYYWYCVTHRSILSWSAKRLFAEKYIDHSCNATMIIFQLTVIASMWQALWVGKMNWIPCCDWLPKWAMTFLPKSYCVHKRFLSQSIFHNSKKISCDSSVGTEWENQNAPSLLHNWKGAWKKAWSDFWSIAIFSFQITLYLLEKIRENLTLQKDSLKTLFHAPLQLFITIVVNHNFLKIAGRVSSKTQTGIFLSDSFITVSYTHLTLPTKLEV